MSEIICPITGKICDDDCEAKRLRDLYFRVVEKVLKNMMEENPNQNRVLASAKARQAVNQQIIQICNSKSKA